MPQRWFQNGRRAGSDELATEDVAPHVGVSESESANTSMERELHAHRVEVRLQREELRRVHDELRRAKAEFHELFDGAPVGFLTLDEHGVICRANVRAAKLFGCSQIDLVGRALHELVMDSSHHILESHLLGVTQHHRREVSDIEARTVAGTLWVELRSDRIANAERERIRCSMVDISERKQDEEALRSAKREAERAAEAKSQFLATMSHEIRTPLHGLLGVAELLGSTQLDVEQRDLVATLRASGDSLLHIINDVLDLSRLEAGGTEARQEVLDVESLFGDIVSSTSVLASERGLDLSCRIERSVPSRLITDPHRLRQVVVNLLGNALKFTTEGWVEVRVGFSYLRDQAILRVSVADSGIGIPADRLPRLFDAFTQADSSISQKFGGSGLGLAISARLARLLGGRLGVESTLGVGSTFHLEVPVSGVAPQTTKALPWAGLRALVVDNSPRSRGSLIELLRQHGAAVASLSSVEQALCLLDVGDSQYDVVFIDVGLAHGASAWSRLRKLSCRVLWLRWPGQVMPPAAAEVGEVMTRPVLAQGLDDVLRGDPEEKLEITVSPQLAEKHPLRVLVVEDNVVSRRISVALLERLGYQAQTANDGMEAVEAAAADDFDLILMDMEMPRLDGVGAAREVLGAGGHRPRIVAVTANVTTADEERCMSAGMSGFLRKPFRAEELARTLLDTRGPNGMASV